MEVAYLPFSKTICKRATTVLQIHGSISRVINRGSRAAFMASRMHQPSPALRKYTYDHY